MPASQKSGAFVEKVPTVKPRRARLQRRPLSQLTSNGLLPFSVRRCDERLARYRPIATLLACPAELRGDGRLREGLRGSFSDNLGWCVAGQMNLTAGLSTQGTGTEPTATDGDTHPLRSIDVSAPWTSRVCPGSGERLGREEAWFVLCPGCPTNFPRRGDWVIVVKAP